MIAPDDTASDDDVGALLGADGPFARELPNFAPRLAQQAMARAVQQTIADCLTELKPVRIGSVPSAR